jgi:hypothetical protein
MAALSFDAAPVPIRDDIRADLPEVWADIGKPGTWLTAERRVAIAAEARNATHCALCAERKAALSPFTVKGEHDSLGDLPDNYVELIHRVMTDSGRLSRKWHEAVVATGITKGEYVEAVGVIVCTVAVDTFHRGIGMDPPPLPEAQAGEPTPYTPPGLEHELAYVPTIDPKRIGPDEAPIYAGGPAHIRRALTSVPETARTFWKMANVLYLPGHQMRDFDNEFRAITHAQIELVAGRVSAINQCVY